MRRKFDIIFKMLKHPNLLYSQLFRLPKETLAKSQLPTTFGFSFMRGSGALPYRRPLTHFLRTKIGKGNLKSLNTFWTAILEPFGSHLAKIAHKVEKSKYFSNI